MQAASEDPRIDLLCGAAAFGYGPASKLVAIAEQLHDKGLQLAFLGTGVAHELACRSEAFREVHRVELDTPSAQAVFSRSRRALCLMDPEFAAAALQRGLELYVADSLFWMWDEIPREFLRASTYWVQDFFGVAERCRSTSPQPVRVGPIITPPSRAKERTRKLVVNLGGYSSPFTANGHDDYLELVVTALRRSKLLAKYAPAVHLIGGTAAIRMLDSTATRLGVSVSSESKQTANKIIQEAALLLTAPGLTATLEAFAAHTPTVFLPPQNYSQWFILEELRSRGLAPHAFHWKDAVESHGVTARLPETLGVPLVRHAVAYAARLPSTLPALTRCLDEVCDLDLQELATLQAACYSSLGANGAVEIAEALSSAQQAGQHS